MDDTPITRREAAKRLLMAAGATAIAGCGVKATEPAGTVNHDRSGTLTPPELQSHPAYTLRNDADYEQLRQSMIWNGVKPNRRPDAIAQATAPWQVKAAIQEARRKGMKIAVRGGGHSWIGAPLRDGGMLIDVSGLDDLRVDPATATITAGPGVKNQDLVKALTPHKLAFPVGHCPGVPLSGYLLGGGFGWNSGVWGPACFSVRGVQVATAEGNVVNASETENPDLFWAVRGAGAGFFGVVTQYTLAAYPLPKVIQSTSLMFDASAAAAVGQWLAAIGPTLAREVELTCLIGSPQDGHRQWLSLWAVVFTDSKQKAAQMLAPLQTAPIASILEKEAKTATFSDLLATMGSLYPAGRRYAVDMTWCNTDAAELLPHMAWAMTQSPSSQSLAMVVVPPAPPKDAPPPPAMALSKFGRAIVGVYGCWADPTNDAKNQAWVKTTSASLNDTRVGHYIGEADLTADKDRPSLCFSAEAWMRLRELKAKYDPAGVFHDFPGI